MLGGTLYLQVLYRFCKVKASESHAGADKVTFRARCSNINIWAWA